MGASQVSEHDIHADNGRPDHFIAIIGAGFGGLGMALELRRLGLDDFVVFDRLGGVGGTWRSNIYPGVGVDTPAQLFQFRDYLNPSWTRLFPKGSEVLSYIERLFSENDLLRHVQLNSEVRSLNWDETNSWWSIEVNKEVRTARFVIAATGPLPEPKPPTIHGIAQFRGQLMHTSSWDAGADLQGKRIAVIGTGASAIQVIPELAPLADHLTVFQRTPMWITPKWDPPIPPWISKTLQQCPSVNRALQRTLNWLFTLTILWVLHYERMPFVAKSTTNFLNRFYQKEVLDDRLLAQLTPTYKFPCKPVSPAHSYLKTYSRPNVELVTAPIDGFTADGIETADGIRREFDVVVLATGFRVFYDPEIYRSRPIRGRADSDMADYMENHPSLTYHGFSMPGFPNYFTMFGPYGWTGGTYHVAVEIAATHIGRVIAEAKRRRLIDVEVSAAAARKWTEKASHTPHTLLTNANCGASNTYYIDHSGISAFYRPMTTRRARQEARSFPLTDYAMRNRTTR